MLVSKTYCDLAVASGGELIGTIVMYAGNTIPSGWLLCNGALISKITYADLFNQIGYIYTLGTTPTTGNFYLPNYQGLFVRGAGSNPNYPSSASTVQAQTMAGQVGYFNSRNKT